MTLAIGILRARREGGVIGGIAGVTMEGRAGKRRIKVGHLVVTPLEAKHLRDWLIKEFPLKPVVPPDET